MSDDAPGCRASEAEHILGFKSPVGNECIAVQRNASWSEKSLIADRRSMTAWAVWGAQMDASMFLSKERSLKTTNLRNLRLLRRRRYRSPCPRVVVIVHDGFRRLIVLNLFAASKERASCCEHFLETDNRGFCQKLGFTVMGESKLLRVRGRLCAH